MPPSPSAPPKSPAWWGRVDSEGAVNVLSYVAVSSADFIRKGRVYNVDKMTQCLKNIRKRLEDQINCDIKQVYVALNCQGMRSITHIEERTFPQRITVQQELIESLKADNRDKISHDQILIDTLRRNTPWAPSPPSNLWE